MKSPSNKNEISTAQKILGKMESRIGDTDEVNVEFPYNHYYHEPPPIVQSIGDMDELPQAYRRLIQLNCRLEQPSSPLLSHSPCVSILFRQALSNLSWNCLQSLGKQIDSAYFCGYRSLTLTHKALSPIKLTRELKYLYHYLFCILVNINPRVKY